MWKSLFLTLVIFIISLNQEIKAQTIEDEIIVQSSKLQVDGIYGAETYTITKSDIQNSTSESIVDLITKYPGVKKQFDIYGTGFGVGSRIDIRGFADTARDNTAILINGQKLTMGDMSLVDLSIIPIDSIQKIEITKGNNSVLYGNNSSAGTVNIITDTLPDQKDSLFTKFIAGSYGKFEGALSGTKTAGIYSITGNTNFVSTNGYRRNNALNQRNGSIEFKGVSENLSYHINVLSHNQFLELPGIRLTTDYWEDPRGTGTPTQFNQRNGYKSFYGIGYSPINDHQIIIDGSYSFDKSQGNLGEFSDTEIYNYQISPRYLFQNNINQIELDNIIGIDLIYANYYSDRMQLDGRHYYTNFKMIDKTTAFYFNSNIKLNQQNKFSIGARYHGNWLKASNSVKSGAYYGGTYTDKSSENFSNPQFAYHFGYEYLLNKDSTISAKIGRSFRYPNLDERIGLNNISFNLGPQKSHDFEISHKLNLENYNVSTTFYYMRLRSEISTTDNSFANRNLAPTERYGIENSVRYAFSKQVSLENSFTLTQSKFRGGDRNGNDLPGVPAYVDSFQINYSPLDYLSTYFNFYYQSNSKMINDFRNFQIAAKGYHTLNIGFTGKYNGFKASLALNNLQNKKYYNYAVGSGSGAYGVASYYPLAGFNTLFKISKQF